MSNLEESLLAANLAAVAAEQERIADLYEKCCCENKALKIENAALKAENATCNANVTMLSAQVQQILDRARKIRACC